MIKNLSVIILAAGKSSRMGKTKFLLKYNKKLTFIEQIIKTYLSFECEEIIIVLNTNGVKLFKQLPLENKHRIKIIENKHLEYERFYSIKIGIEKLINKNSVFIQNSDNPYIKEKTLQTLSCYNKNYDYINPYYNNKGGHPILLSKKVVQAIIKEDKNNLNFKEYLKKFSKKRIDVNDKNILVNINTISQYINSANNN